MDGTKKSRLPSVPVAQFEGEDHPIEFTRVDSQPRLSQQHGQDHPRVDGPPIESVQFLADGIYQPIAPSTDPVNHPGQERVEERGCLHRPRSEEHTSELQSRLHLVCRLLLEKKKYFYSRPRPIQSAREGSFRAVPTALAHYHSTSRETR